MYKQQFYQVESPLPSTISRNEVNIEIIYKKKEKGLMKNKPTLKHIIETKNLRLLKPFHSNNKNLLLKMIKQD
jgi:hypothetical protein